MFCRFRSGNIIHTGNYPDTETVNNVSILSNKNDGFVMTRQKCTQQSSQKLRNTLMSATYISTEYRNCTIKASQLLIIYCSRR